MQTTITALLLTALAYTLCFMMKTAFRMYINSDLAEFRVRIEVMSNYTNEELLMDQNVRICELIEEFPVYESILVGKILSNVDKLKK